MDDFFDRFHAEVLDLDLEGQGSWTEHERLRLSKGVAFHYGDPFAIVLYGQLARDPEVARKETERIEEIIRSSAKGVRRAQRYGELPTRVDPEFAGAAMFGAMRQVMVAALRRTSRPAPERVAEFLWRQVLASVGLDVPPERSERKSRR